MFRSSMPPNSPLVGTIPLIASQTVLRLPGVNVTAVNAATIDNHTVAFMGTNDGKLIKVIQPQALLLPLHCHQYPYCCLLWFNY